MHQKRAVQDQWLDAQLQQPWDLGAGQRYDMSTQSGREFTIVHKKGDKQVGSKLLLSVGILDLVTESRPI